MARDLKPNTDAYRATLVKAEPKKVKKADIKGKVRRKSSPWKRFTRELFVDDRDTIKEYVAKDVIMPTIRNLIFDSVVGSLEMVLYGFVSGGRRPGSRTRGGRNENISYASYYKSNGHSRSADRIVDSGNVSRYQDITFETRADAETVLADLCDLCEEFGQATVGDLLDLCEMTGEFTDQYRGWRRLNTATVMHTRDGYVLKLPKEEVLD